ncbi:hypothetical protein E2562_008408 [Oryza meyeriana var. granulata]|uniref:Uncharacterized protein n=1 Tax=Oryza meyeriana var. granulata TaxID=110450 RepID=A0A6G1EHB8_9ORYZ|nr:hypothetical protein E2562_008408 [Oryza meyeriana var. granulata]
MSTLLVYGVLQVPVPPASSLAFESLPPFSYARVMPSAEKIMRVPYGAEKEFFRYSLFVVFCNRITTSLVSALVLASSSGYKYEQLLPPSCLLAGGIHDRYWLA